MLGFWEYQFINQFFTLNYNQIHIPCSLAWNAIPREKFPQQLQSQRRKFNRFFQPQLKWHVQLTDVYEGILSFVLSPLIYTEINNLQ